MSSATPISPELWAEVPPAARAAILGAFAEFERRIAALEARLGRDSSNSSKPPSTEPIHVKRRPPVPPSGKRRGGQHGHGRHTRELVPPGRLDRAVEVKPRACSGCGHSLDGDDPEPDRHQVAEIPPIRPEVVEYRLHRLACPGCGKATRAKLPDGVPAGAFGPRLHAWVAMLRGVYRLSQRQVVGLCDGLLGLKIAVGTVAKLQRRAAEVLEAPAAAIDDAVRSADSVHVDETGWRESGEKAWLWVAVADAATSFRIDRSRGHDGLESLLGESPFDGRILISDRFPTYARAPDRQLCWAHLRRDFQSMIDRRSGGEVIGERLLGQSKLLYGWWGRLASGRLSRPTLRSYVAGLKGCVRQLLREGSACVCAWTSKVCRKLLESDRHLWRFASAEGVSPDNNAAERALRHGVIWRKTSLGTASASGSRFVERMLSVTETCRRRGADVASYLTDCFASSLAGRPIPSPLA